jgi:isopropylmalate/homocitrate/citramalate synthase
MMIGCKAYKLLGGNMQEPWKTDKWYTSLWNHLPEARKNTKFQKNLKIHDVTLRDGEQQTAVVFRREEKVAIAKKLDAMGIHRIEAGMPAVSEQDKAAISDIAALGLKSEVFAFARCIPDEIKVVKNCGVKGVVVEIPASDHMIKYAYGWSFDRAMKSSKILIHCHQDFGLGVANTLAALEAGASVAHTTITGLGERAGNVPMEDVVLSLLCLHDVNVGIKTEKFVETSKFVMDLAKVQQPPNRPIVGDKLYEVESGIIAGWVRLCRAENPLEYVPFSPELVGQKPVNIVLGKNSGPPSIEEWAEKNGLKITDEERMALLLAVKAKSFEKKDLLTAEEFKDIVGKTLKNAATV